MAQYSYKNIDKFRYLDSSSASGPPHDIESQSLRDKVLRNVLMKQLKTDLTLNECLINKRKFTSSTKQESDISGPSGLKSFESFKGIADDKKLREILSSCKFDSQEINYLIDGKKDALEQSSELSADDLTNIEQKLQRRLKDLSKEPPETFSDAVELNRYEYEEECRNVGSEVVEKLTPCLVKLKPRTDPTLHPEHPWNKIKELAQELFPTEITSDPVIVVDKAKVVSPKREPKRLKCEQREEQFFVSKPGSFWDMKEIPIVKSSSNAKSVVKGCQNQSANIRLKTPIIVAASVAPMAKTDFTKPFVWTLDSQELIPLSEIERNRCDEKMICENPKFNNYHPGIPSRTLFLKNLPRKLNPIGLVRLFGHFENDQQSKIEYRILGGRMKGQAFIKFHNTETSKTAFDCCNGYILDGQPIVIEYSKRNDKQLPLTISEGT